MAEQTDDFVASLRSLIKSEMIDVNTSLNGVVTSYSNGLATVRPTANKAYQDGDSLPFPLIYNVPVRWPSFNGGACGFKGPIKPGDNVLVVFAQQATDGTDDQRRFDLNDAYCIPAHNATTAQGGNNDDTILYFGSAYIKLTSAGAMEINAPGGCKTISPNNEFTGNVLVDQKLTSVGLFTFLGGMIGSASSGASAVITGAINFIGSLTSNGKNISDSHTHTGVTPGGGTTGGVS